MNGSPTVKPRVKGPVMRVIGTVSVAMCMIAVICGTLLFDKKNCLDRWFVDEDVLCKDCIIHFGDECLDCNAT